MIEILKAPAENALILDGNRTNVVIKSFRGQDYHFNAQIFIDDVLFNTITLPRDVDGIARVNLKHLYASYFDINFFEIQSTPFLLDTFTHLQRRVKIIVQEIFTSDDSIIETKSLPEYTLLYNDKPIDIPFNEPIAPLSPKDLTIPILGKARFTAYAKQGIITGRLKRNNQVIHEFEYSLELEIASIISVAFNLENLSEEITSQLDTNFVFEFGIDNDVISSNITVIPSSYYKPKMVYYRDNFGNYNNVYLFGAKEVEHKIDKETYEDSSSQELVYYTSTMEETTLSSGNHLNELTPIMTNVAQSIDVKLYLDDVWKTVYCTTDEIVVQVERQYIYQEVLKFSRNLLQDIDNANYLQAHFLENGLTFTIQQNEQLEIPKETWINLGESFNGDRLRFLDHVSNGKLDEDASLFYDVISDYQSPQNPYLLRGIALDTLLNIIYQPGVNLLGTPLESLRFQLGDEFIWSNPVTLTINVSDTPTGNQPPIITSNTYEYSIPVNGSGDGSIDVETTITDPENDAVTILWDANGNAPLSFNAPNNEDTRVDLSNATVGESYIAILSATDTSNNITTKNFKFTARNHLVVGDFTEDAQQSSSTYRVYNFNLNNMRSGGSLDLVFEAIFQTQDDYAVIFSERTQGQRLMDGRRTLLRENIVATQDGTLSFKITINNPTESLDIRLNITLENAKDGVFINPGSDTVTITTK